MSREEEEAREEEEEEAEVDVCDDNVAGRHPLQRRSARAAPLSGELRCSESAWGEHAGATARGGHGGGERAVAVAARESRRARAREASANR